jgi:hypothetical protein
MLLSYDLRSTPLRSAHKKATLKSAMKLKALLEQIASSRLAC